MTDPASRTTGGRSRDVLIAVLLVFAAVLFVERAHENGQLVNTRISRTDQGAYIKQAIEMQATGFSAVNPRNRMPLYPGLLAVFMDKGDITANPDRDALAAAFFDKGKAINIALAVAVLSLVGVVFYRSFPRHHATNALLFAAFGVLVFKAPHVQAEVLYYGLSFLAFVLCWRLCGRPRWWVAVLAGVVAGFAHLTKASVLPGLLVVIVFLPLDGLWARRRDGRRAWGKFVAPALVAAAFLATVWPYISTSKKIFGHYFYNVNSTFYMWTDSWEEAVSRTRAAGDRKGWPDLPPDELPSLSNYLNSHTPGQIVWRVVNGLSLVFQSMRASYGYLWLSLAYVAAAAALCAVKWRLVWRVVSRRPVPLLAVLAYFVGYYLLYAWYSQIIRGNRFVLALFLPFLFSVSAVIVTLGPRVRWKWMGRPWDALCAFNCAVSIWLAAEVAVTCLHRIPATYGGS